MEEEEEEEEEDITTTMQSSTALQQSCTHGLRQLFPVYKEERAPKRHQLLADK